VPDVLHDRETDNWRPLLALSGLAGGPWPELAWAAAVALSGVTDEDAESLGVLLLRDVAAAFEAAGTDRLGTAELVGWLVAQADRPWTEANRGRPVTARWLASRLRLFGVSPRTIRAGNTIQKGYLLADLADATLRYATPPAKTLQRYNPGKTRPGVLRL